MDNIKFISHCDHENCDMGMAEYTCPECNKNIVDYDAWYEYETKDKIEIICSECSTPLIIEFMYYEGWIISKNLK